MRLALGGLGTGAGSKGGAYLEEDAEGEAGREGVIVDHGGEEGGTA